MGLQLSVGARAYCLRVCCGFACAGTLAFHYNIQGFGRPQGTLASKMLLELSQGTLLLFEFGLRLAHLHLYFGVQPGINLKASQQARKHGGWLGGGVGDA